MGKEVEVTSEVTGTALVWWFITFLLSGCRLMLSGVGMRLLLRWFGSHRACGRLLTQHHPHAGRVGPCLVPCLVSLLCFLPIAASRFDHSVLIC
jgi:hypothetical protein